MKDKRTLIVYQMFKETEVTDFFLDHGVTYDKNIDYVFVINVPYFNKDPIGFTPSEKFTNTIESVSAKVLYRDNTGRDFGGYACAVDRFSKNGLIDSYDFFIFMNQTAMGPFLPDWSKGLFHWSNIFTGLINEKDRLAGLSINCLICRSWEKGKSLGGFGMLTGLNLPKYGLSPDGKWIFAPHVQTMLFVTDKAGLKLAVNEGIFNYENIQDDKHRMIIEKEIRLSEIMLENDYNLASILECSRGVDFRKGNFHKAWVDVWHSTLTDVSTDFLNKWKEPVTKMKSTHPYETVFVKANVGVKRQKDFLSNFIKSKKLSINSPTPKKVPKKTIDFDEKFIPDMTKELRALIKTDKKLAQEKLNTQNKKK